MPQRIYFKVHGKVQGVFFRAFTQKKATAAAITGWCQNTESGKVEGEAQGTEDAIKQFLKDINNGPPHAKVVKLEQEDRDVQNDESQFEIR
ncbi:acylphosphatase [Pseudomassariella vexata]|uniref:Acylphosphatase n=1 Tax=Pseudomassariella vexata TaxID=1141098 RepID=A0A1Y2E3A6_9PEZI|nr:acylphosphatase [Pseudomassariella vexata]ORY66023.1 acylphosphatase [Pseudomassariella vexata]